MRISTASTRKSIDRWRGRAKAHLRRSQYWGMEYVSKLLASPQRGRVMLVPPVVMALSVNFAFLELGILLLVGFFIAKLHFYRFLNAMTGLFGFAF